jgi:hypothetical protein
MDEPPFSLAFVMVKESFVVPAILFYIGAPLVTKDGGGGTLTQTDNDPNLFSYFLSIRG